MRHSKGSRSKSRRSKSRKKSPQKTWRSKLLKFFGVVFGILILTLMAGFGVVDYTVTQKFSGKKWALAARVYARPLELYVGAKVSDETLKAELSQLSYQPVSYLSSPGQVIYQRSKTEIYLRKRTVNGRTYPAQKIQVQTRQQTIASLRVNGKATSDIVVVEPLEIGAIYPASGEDRILTRLEDIPPLLGETLIAVEDKNFIHHHGISFKAIARAMVVNLRSGEIVQGGSTLTQQLVKNLYLSNERSISRKVIEALMTISLELHYSKAEILETYINEVYLGQAGRRGIHGFALASQFYFDEPIENLNTQQVALLVGLVKGASYYNPRRNPERATARRNTVLDVMAESGLISAHEARDLSKKPLAVTKTPSSQHAYPAFIDLVKQQLLRDYELEDLQSEGLQVHTTLSPSLQSVLENGLSKRLSSLEKGYKINRGSLQGAGILTAVGSAEVLAVIGDRNPRYKGFNRALNAKRPVGSLIKPAIYLAALESGDYSLATTVDDSEVAVDLGQGNVWRPNNFDNKDHGHIPLYNALAQSYNQSAARVGMSVGLREVFNAIERLGIDEPLPQVPAILLGAVELSPYDMSHFYHTIANDGIYSPLRAVRSVYTSEGEWLQRYPLEASERIEPADAYFIDFALQVAARQGTAKSIYSTISPDIALAGKTGTTNDQRDSWFAGYSGNLQGVFWVGTDDNQPLPLTGSSGALRIWTDVFSKASLDGINKVKPSSVEYYWIDSQSGLLSKSRCQNAVSLPLLKGHQPKTKSRCVPVSGTKKPWWQRLWGN